MTSIPSHLSYRYLLPGKSRFEHWRGVYYQCRVSPQAYRRYKAHRQEGINAKIKAFRSEISSLETLERELEMPHLDHSMPADLVAWSLYKRLCTCNDYGLLSSAMNHFQHIKDIDAESMKFKRLSSGNRSENRIIIPEHAFPSLIRSFRAEKISKFYLEAYCDYDDTETIKKIGEFQGLERVDSASQVSEFSIAKIQENSKSVTGDSILQIDILNSLMEVMLTGGYHSCRQVFEQTYDSISLHSGLKPTLDTYLNVMRALCLCGNLKEAESIFSWLKLTLGPQGLGNEIRPYNILLEGYRENKDYESTESLMKELLDSRFPTITPETAEIYLRTIIDRAYTPIAGDMSYYGQPYHAELKKIPLIMQRLATHGINISLLSPPVLFHVNDAFISYKVSDSLKYVWNRSSGQFDFLNMRRSAQYVDDVQELVSSGGMKGNPQEKDQKGGTGQIPYYGRHGQKKSWEMLPSDSLFYQFHVEEQMRDTRMETKNTLVATDLYKRSPQWMHEVPQTRFDQLQSLNNIDFKTIGIRRHLNPDAPGNDESIMRDDQIYSSATTLGKKATGKRKLHALR